MRELTRAYDRQRKQAERDRRRSLGVCINSDNHGPATHGLRCDHCAAVHLRSANRKRTRPGGAPTVRELVRMFAASIRIQPFRQQGEP